MDCLKNNKKFILFIIFIFIIIYLLTRHNENFDASKLTYSRNQQRESQMSVDSTFNGLYFQSGNIYNTDIDGSKITNSFVNNTRIEGSEINMSDINNPTINGNTTVNGKLTTTGTIRLNSQKINEKITNEKEVFTLLSNSEPNTPDQLFINVDGRSSIDFLDNNSHIRLGDQFLNRDKLQFLDELYSKSKQ